MKNLTCLKKNKYGLDLNDDFNTGFVLPRVAMTSLMMKASTKRTSRARSCPYYFYSLLIIIFGKVLLSPVQNELIYRHPFMMCSLVYDFGKLELNISVPIWLLHSFLSG